MGFTFLALGRFDDRQFYLGPPIDGETAIYWTAAAALLILFLFLALGIHETDPKSRMRGKRFSIRLFFTSVLSKNLLPIYFLIFGYAMITAGLGTLAGLLFTEQWHFTKQEMGNNAVVGGVINIFLIVFLGFFADKINRLKSYQVLAVLTVVVNFAFYLYVNFFLYDRRPILVELILSGEALSIIGILMSTTYEPMVYDYVPRNEMGAYMAGAGLLNRVTILIALNGTGLFIWAYAVFLLPPAGDMTRVVFRESMTTEQVAGLLTNTRWVDTVEDAPETRRGKTRSPGGWHRSSRSRNRWRSPAICLSAP